MEKYFSTHEVAKLCQVTRGSVIRWIHEGKLAAATTLGGHHRVQANNLYHLLKSLRMNVPAGLENLAEKPNPIRILIVDDEANILIMLREFFKKKFPEFSAHEASDGFAAGLLVRDLKPDLILLDLMLPGIDGFRVCQQIRAQRELDHTKIIAITGMQDEKAQNSVLALGADDFLNKPLNLALLAERIRHHLSQAAGNLNQPQIQGGTLL